MGVYAAGNSYGIPEDLIYSFPVQIKVGFGHSVDNLCAPFFSFFFFFLHFFGHLPQDKTWKIVDGLPINDFSRKKMDATAAELVEERDTALSL